MPSFFAELKRRNVVKVGAAYAAAAWLLAQVTETVLPVFDLPNAFLRVVFIVLAIGFPVTLVLAWIYDLTPEGIQRTDDMPIDSSSARLSGRGLDFTIIGCLSVAVLFLVMDRFVWSPPSDRNTKSIAVLPFEVERPDSDTGYLGDGITDRLIMRLSRLPGLRVKSRSMLRAGEENAQTIGQLLDVDTICLGRLIRNGDVLEIAVELINVIDGSVIWSDRLQRDLSTLVNLEGEVSAEIASALSIELTDEQEVELFKSPTDNPDAYRLYLQGRHFWNQRSADGLRQSADFYRQAVDLDPGYALAWSGLADSYLMLFAWGLERPQEVMSMARAAAERAIDLDSNLAEPHATLGYYKTLYERDWDGARSEFLKSIELNDSYSTAHHWYAFFHSTVGDSSAAIQEIRKARNSEPLSPIINAEVGLFLVYDGQFEQAIEELKAASLWNPDFPTLRNTLVRAYALNGQHDKAFEIWQESQEPYGDSIVASGFGNMVLPEIGRHDEAREFYHFAVELSDSEYVMPGLLGVLAAGTGDYDAAFGYFEAAVQERSMVLSWLRDPLIEDIREDSRYAELLEQVGLMP